MDTLSITRTAWAGALAAGWLAMATATAGAQQPDSASPSATTASGHVISSHQIDRFEAIQQLQADLKSDPNNVADHVILGEMAQEVATEVPSDQARDYYRMARESFESALKLRPNDPAIQAAARFARDQESDAPRFDQARKQATITYLDARRREMGQSGAVPSVRVYGNPAPVAAQPAQGNSNMSGYEQSAYGQPAYRPYTGSNGQPYTYDQHSRGYFPPNIPQQQGALAQPGQVNAGANPSATQAPQTLRQYSQQLPNVLMNEAVRRATGTTPGAAGIPATPR